MYVTNFLPLNCVIMINICFFMSFVIIFLNYGIQALATFENCSSPDPIDNGFIVFPREPDNFFKTGDTVEYKCDKFFSLIDYNERKCVDGYWVPKRLPRCIPDYNIQNNAASMINSCSPIPNVPNASFDFFPIQPLYYSTGTYLKITCKPGYRNEKDPCSPESDLYCQGDGNWKGEIPNCVKVDRCDPPKQIPHGFITRHSYSVEYVITSEITYSCEQQYTIENPESSRKICVSGCWEPDIQPVCVRSQSSYAIPYDENIRVSTAELLMCVVLAIVGISLIFMIICLLNTCRQRYQNYRQGQCFCRNVDSLLHSTSANSILPPSLRRNNFLSFSNDGADATDDAYLPTYEEVMQQDALAAAIINENSARATDENPNIATAIPIGAATTNYSAFSPYGIRMFICRGNISQNVPPSVTLDGRIQTPRTSATNVTAAQNQQSNNSRRIMHRIAGPEEPSTSESSNNEINFDNASSRTMYGSLGSFEMSSETTSEGVPLLPDAESESTCSSVRIIPDK